MLQSCKRKIWECIGHAERQRYLDKKIKTKGYFVENKENAVSSVRPKELSPVPANASNQEQSMKSSQPKNNPGHANIEFSVNAMKVADLKKQLKARGYDTGGLKKDLRARLLDVMIAELEAEECQILSQSSIKVEPEKPKKPIVSQVTMDEEKTNTCNDLCEKGINHDQNGPSDMVVDELMEQDENNRESISSMQVELNSSEVGRSKEQQKDQAVEPMKIVQPKSPIPESKASSDARAKSTVSENKEMKSVTEKKETEDNITIMKTVISVSSVADNEKPSRLLDAENLKKLQSSTVSESFKLRLDKNESCDAVEDYISPPASEVSSISKSSMVKDMVSKFSGFSSSTHSSTSSGGSALSKSLQLKKDARIAKMNEMRVKVRKINCLYILNVIRKMVDPWPLTCTSLFS
jgi:hypothetical protein